MKKFLTFLALACFMVAGAWAQAYQLGSKVTDLASLSAEKLYAIHSTNNEGYWCYNSTINQNYVGITGVKTDGSGVVGNAAANTAYHAAFQPGNVNNQWKITNEDGAYYLYNVGAGQYVTRTDRDYLFTTEKTALDAIHANANGSFAIHAGGGYSGGSTNFACIVTNSTPQAVRNWTSTDHGSMLEFFEIEEISQLQDDLNALIATVEEAYAANDEAIWGANLITANSQFSSNATESSEGNINNLLDGNLSSYWHSQWSAGDKPMHTHYLQVTLTEAIEGSIQMTMGRRQGANNDHPMEMSVEYSTDNSTYTLLEGQSMEFSGTTGYVYGTFTLPTAAKYLRFYVDRTDKMRGYWHCSEFQLKSLFKQAANDQHPTEAAALQNALATAKAVTSATQTDIDNLQAALNTYKAAVDPVKTNITWNLYDGTTLVDSETKADCEKDREYTTTLTVPYGYLIDGTKTVTATNENQIITLTRVVDPAFPFQYADSKENIQHWYALNIHHNNKHYVYYSADATPNVQANVTTYQTAPEYAWGFVGNPADGFVIYNKASDTALYSADNNTSCTVGATASTFKATLTGWTAAQADGGFCLNVDGQQYVNFQGDQLKHWGSNDSGSTFHAIEIDFSLDAAYKEAKAAALQALTGAANIDLYAATDIATANSAIDGITYEMNETSVAEAIAKLDGIMDTFYATADGKKFALVSKNDWSTRGVTRYLATSNNTTDRLTAAENVELFSVFTATYDAANKGYKVAMAYTPTIYLPVTGSASSAIVPSETPGYYTFVGGASATDPAMISCISSTVSNSQGGIHLDGGKNIVVWGPDGAASKWAFEIVSDEDYETLKEAYESAQKTYAFVLTGPDGTEYEGTYTSEEENATPACVEGLILSNENWEDVSEYGEVDYVYTADFEFPFPVNTPTFIYAFTNDSFQWKSTSTDVTVQKNLTGTDETFRFTIVPTFSNDTFTYTIADATGNKVYTEATSRSHDAGTVTFSETGTPFVWTSGAFKLTDKNLYLSVNSSNVDDATVQYLGVWDSAHNGTKLKFVVYEPVTSINITIGATGYATIAYYETIVNKPEGLKVYYCINEGEAGHLTPVEWDKDYIPGYCAYILEGTPNTTYTVDCVDSDTFEFPDTDYDAVADIFYNGVLYGNFDDTAMTVEEAKAVYGENIYVFSKVDDKVGFYTYVGTTLAAHKAFYATENASINGFSLDFEGTEGVNSVISATNLKAGYDIQGRRINKIQKGINILNGKKIIK